LENVFFIVVWPIQLEEH
jgi:hypothetical protein